MMKLFKNAKLVNLEIGNIQLTDILVENGKIEKIQSRQDSACAQEVLDLEGNYVLPSFVNSFSDSVSAFQKNYFKLKKKSQIDKVCDLFYAKNLLAGAVFSADVAKNEICLIDKIEEKDEKALSDLSLRVAKEKRTPFLKIGQDLESLGSIDKEYGKSVSRVLEDFGFLDRRAVIVGGNCLEKDELETFRNYDCDFVILPNDDGKFGRRAVNLVSLISKGFNIALGSGNSSEIDFFAYMRQLIFGVRSLFEDVDCINERQVLGIATNGSVLGVDDAIKVGEDATFIVVRARESLYDDIFKTLVWEMSKRDVFMCVKNGEVLQKNGEIFMKNATTYDTMIRNLKQ